MYLNNFVSWKFETRNVSGVARHQIAVEHAEDALMSDNKEIVLLAFEFEYNWLQTYGEVVIRLIFWSVLQFNMKVSVPFAPLLVDIDDDKGLPRAS